MHSLIQDVATRYGVPLDIAAERLGPILAGLGGTEPQSVDELAVHPAMNGVPGGLEGVLGLTGHDAVIPAEHESEPDFQDDGR